MITIMYVSVLLSIYRSVWKLNTVLSRIIYWTSFPQRQKHNKLILFKIHKCQIKINEVNQNSYFS